jgi:hypothetical protein
MPDRIGIIVNGVTGRMAKNQHLINSLLPIQREGGITLANGKRLPDIMVVGRNTETIQRVAAELEIEKGVQLAELSLQSWQERKWIDVPDVEA